MTRGRFLCAATSLALVFAACGGGDDSGATEPGGRLELTLTVVEGTSIEVTVGNTSGEPMTVVRPFVTPHFVEFTVTGPDGSEVPFDGPNVRLEPLVDSDVVSLAPGGSVSVRYDLADHFTLPPGTYNVSAQYQAEEVHLGGLAATISYDDPVIADPVEVEVAP